MRLERGPSPTCHILHAFDLRIVFSYETPVAFWTPGTGWVVSENAWGPTTGKHIKATVPDAAPRFVRDDFVALFERHIEGVVAE